MSERNDKKITWLDLGENPCPTAGPHVDLSQLFSVQALQEIEDKKMMYVQACNPYVFPCQDF